MVIPGPGTRVIRSSEARALGADLRSRKRERQHEINLELLKGAQDLAKIILSEPVVWFIGGNLAIQYLGHTWINKSTPDGPRVMPLIEQPVGMAMQLALGAAFVAGSVGGGGGISSIIKAIKG
jgi:hypothetical protein